MNDRRAFLKGVTLGAGSVLLGPILRSLEAQADGKGDALPRRVVFVVESNGLFPHHLQPKGLARPKGGSDRLIDQPLAAQELPAEIAPLAPWKDRLTILQGLSGRVAEGGTGGHSTNHGALGCYPGNRGPMAQTVDAALADALPGVIPQVALGIHNRPETTVHYALSAAAPGKAVPIQCRPDLAYAALFGSVAPGNGKQSFDLQTNLLDYMADDVRRVRGALAGPERDRLDPYLESFESLRDRQKKILGIQENLKKHAPATDKFKSPHETDRLEGQFDLAAAALVAGLTNVVTLSSGGGGQHYITYAGLGLPIDGHAIGHGKGIDGKTPEECRSTIREFHARLIARLASKLQAVPEGNGTVLDRTLIVYLSDSGESHHPGLREWPVLLLGNFGGRLKAGGRIVEYPRYQTKGHRTTANLYLSLLAAAGAPRETFGLQDIGLMDLDLKGPLPELAV